MPALLALFLAAVINASGSALFKLASQSKALAVPRYWFLFAAAMFCYMGCFPLYAMALSRLKLSLAQPLFSGLSFLTVTAFSLLIFRERIGVAQIIGMSLILLGVVVVAINK
jgi:multidrug transporter EmrE-like cation transporter